MLEIDSVRVVLTPNQEIELMTDVTVGHTISLAITYLDQNGNPMLTTPVPDSAPVWSNSTPATETLAVDPTGNSATATTVAVGTDVISVSLTVGGTAFSATLGVNVTAVPQVLTSIAIAPTVN